LKQTPRWLFRLLCCGCAGLGPPAAALEYQVHGFAAQGFVLSEGNDLFGNSRDGSFDLYELGLNATAVFTPALIGSAQLLYRDAGETDNDGLRVDYALIDWQFLSQAESGAGIRLGRVRNPFGLYNETRDVVFTRPGILLPQSVYFEGAATRSLLFSSDGGQLYGRYAIGAHEWSAVAGFAPARGARSEEQRALTGGGAFPADLELGNFFFSRLQDEWNNWLAGLSYVNGSLTFEQGASTLAEFEFDVWIASLRYAAARYSVTAEYSLIRSEGQSVFTGPFRSSSDGGYIQYDYRLTPRWTLYGRADASWSDRNDRDGRRYEDQTGQDRHLRYAYDGTLGVRWLPDEHWGFWTEGHLIEGGATVSGLDNPGREPDPHWSALLLMAAYRF